MAEERARHIDSLCGDRVLAHSIGEKMEAYARRMFTPEILTRQVMEMYLEVRG